MYEVFNSGCLEMWATYQYLGIVLFISGLSSLPDIIFDDQDDVNDNESDLTPVPGVELDESDKCPETALQFFKTSVIEDAHLNKEFQSAEWMEWWSSGKKLWGFIKIQIPN